MDYRLRDLIDIKKLQEILDRIHEAFVLPSAILDDEGEVLTASGWQPLCTDFHRANPTTAAKCHASDMYIRDHLEEAKPSVSYECALGLVDAATPILVDGEHLGTVFIGQFFLGEPDMERFQGQARAFGFEVEPYMDAVRQVPVIDRDKMDRSLAFVRDFTEFISQLGLERLRQLRTTEALEESENRIRELNDELERRVHQRTSELGEANQELESFAYSVSHDLRSPLRGIDGWSLALLEDYGEGLDETANGYLGTIRSETLRMGELIDALLDLSRVTRAGIHRKEVDLASLALPIVERLRYEQPEREVDVSLEEGLVVFVDEALMNAVLENLLGNAWKFTAGREEARIELCSTEHDGEHAYVVRDNGAGFDEAYASKLFAPFQRLHRVQDFAGTGIGLATVQRIIRRHGGRVWAEGEIDQGASIYFTL